VGYVGIISDVAQGLKQNRVTESDWYQKPLTVSKERIFI
jgi:hypothetical protein